MEFETLLQQAELDPTNGKLIAALLVSSARVNDASLTDALRKRLYNLFASVFTSLEGNTHNALHTALQRALLQPAVIEYFHREMEASSDMLATVHSSVAAPVILALLCTHDDIDIATRAAIALGYTGSQLAYDMLQRWSREGTNKKLVQAAELALPYFAEMAD